MTQVHEKLQMRYFSLITILSDRISEGYFFLFRQTNENFPSVQLQHILKYLHLSFVGGTDAFEENCQNIDVEIQDAFGETVAKTGQLVVSVIQDDLRQAREPFHLEGDIDDTILSRPLFCDCVGKKLNTELLGVDGLDGRSTMVSTCL